MSFALLIVGTVLLISAIKSTHSDLFALLKSDFTGPNNFIFWFVSILLIGALGYIPKLKPLSTAFLVLVVIVLLFSKGDPKGAGGGFFSQFITQLKSTTTPTPAKTDSTTPGATGGIKDFSDLLNVLPLSIM